MHERLIKFLATGGGAGLAPVAPGTFGSVVGVGYWWLLIQLHNAAAYWLIAFAVVVFAVWCAGRAATILGQPDPPSVVIDEITAMPLALAGLDVVWWQIAVGFAMFRLFDVWKPWPVRQSQRLPGGTGIVVDDLLAALYACATTQLISWAVGHAY